MTMVTYCNQCLYCSGGRWRKLALVALALVSLAWLPSLRAAQAATVSYPENQVAVTLAPGASIAAFDAAHGTTITQQLADRRTYVLSLPSAQTADEAVASDQFDLAYAQIYLAFEGNTFPVTATSQWALTKIQSPSAHIVSKGQGITVAVLDTGGRRLVAAASESPGTGGYDYVAQTAAISDVIGGAATGHGTFVAGLIAQVAPAAHILPYRVLDQNGLGSVANVAAAVEAAANAGAQVINLSMGMPLPSATLHQAIQYTQAHGAVVVASAGNSNTWAPAYPAAWPGVVAVAETDQRDLHTPFSNYGSWISVTAPAVNLYSAYPGGYAIGDGTSFAAPLVAGELAVVRAARPKLPPVLYQLLVRESSVDISAWNPGYGTCSATGASTYYKQSWAIRNLAHGDGLRTASASQTSRVVLHAASGWPPRSAPAYGA